MFAYILSTTLLIADWSQTLTISEDPEYLESNIVLSETPSKAKVNVYFVGVLAANTAVHWLPVKQKTKQAIWHGMSLVEFQYVANNAVLGVKFNYNF